jgi:hypothetical protein
MIMYFPILSTGLDKKNAIESFFVILYDFTIDYLSHLSLYVPIVPTLRKIFLGTNGAIGTNETDQ